jgi:hypothetical protein
MTVEQSPAVDVLIAGSSIAASASAMALLNCGIHPLLIATGRQALRMAEAIPRSAIRLFDALQLTGLLEKVGFQAGSLLHVDRSTLADAMLEQAIRRGASLIRCERLPNLRQKRRRVLVTVDGRDREFLAAIDATGRAAAWSRPIKRFGRMFADIFSIATTTSSMDLKLARSSQGWAYRVGLPHYTIVSVLSRRHPRLQQLPCSIRAQLEIGEEEGHYLGRRAASAQWAEDPVRGLALAVGDAAFAHDPVAGQGIRFALGTALAAAAVINTWTKAPSDSALASDFYRDLVGCERRRHLSFLRSFYPDNLDTTLGSDSAHKHESQPPDPSWRNLASEYRGAIPTTLRFCATTSWAGLHVDSIIKRGEVLTLRDGAARWLGTFDLLKLRQWLRRPTNTTQLIVRLIEEHLDLKEIDILLRWCLARGVLASGK